MLEPNEDSFLIYWPKIKDLPIKQPKSKIVLLSKKEFKATFDGCPQSLVDKVAKAITSFTLPVFIRTDLSSAKHYWKTTCFYDGQKDLRKHLYGIMEFNHCADFFGLPFVAIVIREYIPMASGFTAFYGDMPVNPERRYFIKDGQVVCHHHYWIEEAIDQSKEPSEKSWRDIAKNLNHESKDEIDLLTGYALQVAQVMDGFWSVDFCKAVTGDWYLIDMATGQNSWHPLHE